MTIELKHILLVIIVVLYLFSSKIKFLLIQFGIIKLKFKPNIQITEYGIEIAFPKNKNSEKIKWNDIEDIKLTTNNTLNFVFKNKTERILRKKEYSNWMDIIKTIPDGLKNDTIKNFSREYFKDLKTCKVCGKIAVKDDSCLHCISDQNLDNLKQKQLFWFSIDDKNENVDFFYRDLIYETDKNWKPIVTKNDILNKL